MPGSVPVDPLMLLDVHFEWMQDSTRSVESIELVLSMPQDWVCNDSISARHHLRSSEMPPGLVWLPASSGKQ
jgi:hypothetical protein